MQTIGERLEEARKRKGISIREAAEATKIRSDYLHKLESNSFDLNLPEIYIRGFLHNYAAYLKLNPDKLLTDYKTLAPAEGRASRRDNRETYGRMDLAPAAGPTTDTTPAAALVLVIAIIFGLRAISGGSSRSAPEIRAMAQETITLIARDTVRVKLVQELDGAEIFQGTLIKGESRTFPKRGSLLLTAAKFQNVDIEVNGKRKANPYSDYMKVQIP
jgi:cytoskeletal protein RodZ